MEVKKTSTGDIVSVYHKKYHTNFLWIPNRLFCQEKPATLAFLQDFPRLPLVKKSGKPKFRGQQKIHFPNSRFILCGEFTQIKSVFTPLNLWHSITILQQHKFCNFIAHISRHILKIAYVTKKQFRSFRWLPRLTS